MSIQRFSPLAARLFSVGFAASFLAALLGLAAAGDSVLPGDLAITRQVQRALPWPLESLAHLGHGLGSTVGAIILLGCAILFFASRRAWPETAFLVIASAVRLLAGLLKPVFDSPRPPPDLVIVSGTFHGSGYPSGHAMTGAVIGLAFAVLAWRGIADRRLAAATAILSLATGFMVGWSRIALGAHWPSDVLGGFLAGIAIVAFAAGVVTRFEATGGRNQWT